jgi:hypothetical protein
MGAYSTRTIYKSLRQCSSITGIPKEKLSAAKTIGGMEAGFRTDNHIDFDVYKQWLEKNEKRLNDYMATLDTSDKDSIAHYKKEIAKRDVTLKELQIQKMKGEMVDPEEVNQFLVAFASQLSATIKKKKDELSTKCTGFESVIDKEFVDLFKMLEETVTSWGSK